MADKYKGKFNDGWDAYRVHERQLEKDIIPPGTKLTPRDETMQAWGGHPRKPDPGVHVIDPFADTGNLMMNLIGLPPTTRHEQRILFLSN